MKAALVTGGAVRVGRGVAERLAAAGYALALQYRHSKDEAEAVAKDLRSRHQVEVVLVWADLSSADTVRTMCQTALNALGTLDLLVNGAATFYPTRTLTESLRAWDDFQRVNLQAPLVASVACADALAARSGSIVNIGDIYGSFPLKGYLPYSVSKAGLLALTRGLALELAPSVRVNAVAPGAILLPVDAGPEKEAALVRDIPAGHMGNPADIAEAVLYLANAPFVTGHILTIDGGRSLNL